MQLGDGTVTVVDRLLNRMRRAPVVEAARPETWLTRLAVPGSEQPFDVVFYRDGDGWYIGEVPELPGCVSQGESLESFMTNIVEAIEGCRHTRMAEGLPERIDLTVPVPVLS